MVILLHLSHLFEAQLWCQAINTHTAILLWRVHQVYPKAMEQISLPFLRRR